MKNKTSIGRTLFALAMVISLTSALATTASADEWRDHERDAHEWHHHHMHRHDRPVVVQQPNVVYAPPVVIQAPVANSVHRGLMSLSLLTSANTNVLSRRHNEAVVAAAGKRYDHNELRMGQACQVEARSSKNQSVYALTGFDATIFDI